MVGKAGSEDNGIRLINPGKGRGFDLPAVSVEGGFVVRYTK
jgi:hypothetical protein